MPVLREWDLQLDVDTVLRAQGADPARLRARGSSAVEVAERALAIGRPLLRSAVAYQYHAVRAFRHERLSLGQDGASLKGPLVAKHLFAARDVVVMVCTVGPDLEAAATAHASDDLALSVALDGLASAAVDLLASQACHWADQRAEAEGLKTTVPISPGLLGWPVASGQPELFSLVDAAQAGVHLNDGCMMVPHKSTSLVLGIGPDVSHDGDACDYCSMGSTCRFREEHARHG